MWCQMTNHILLPVGTWLGKSVFPPLGGALRTVTLQLTDEVDAVLWSPQLLDQMLHIFLQEDNKQTMTSSATSPSRQAEACWAPLTLTLLRSKVSQYYINVLLSLHSLYSFICKLSSIKFWESNWLKYTICTIIVLIMELWGQSWWFISLSKFVPSSLSVSW